MLDKDVDIMDTRKDLFSVMAGLQLTLDEVRAGMIKPLIGRLVA